MNNVVAGQYLTYISLSKVFLVTTITTSFSRGCVHGEHQQNTDQDLQADTWKTVGIPTPLSYTLHEILKLQFFTFIALIASLLPKL